MPGTLTFSTSLPWALTDFVNILLRNLLLFHNSKFLPKGGFAQGQNRPGFCLYSRLTLRYFSFRPSFMEYREGMTRADIGSYTRSHR